MTEAELRELKNAWTKEEHEKYLAAQRARKAKWREKNRSRIREYDREFYRKRKSKGE